jgi:pimeloyl-ACP methyl ester carboxylesterase
MPSLPGFTFSGAIRRGPPGSRVAFTNAKLAMCCDAVMRALGYDAYVAQGGDVGSAVVRACAQLFPDRCRSIRARVPSLLSRSWPDDLAQTSTLRRSLTSPTIA